MEFTICDQDGRERYFLGTLDDGTVVIRRAINGDRQTIMRLAPGDAYASDEDPSAEWDE